MPGFWHSNYSSYWFDGLGWSVGDYFHLLLRNHRKHRAGTETFSFLSWGIACCYFPLHYYLLSQKTFHSKGIVAAKAGGWAQSSYSTTGNFYYMDPFGAADSATRNSRNANKAEHCHRPEMSCGSVKSDHPICQHELSKRPFHHVPIY